MGASWSRKVAPLVAPAPAPAHSAAKEAAANVAAKAAAPKSTTAPGALSCARASRRLARF